MPFNIEVGDEVTIRHEPRLRSDNNNKYIVEVVKATNQSPFWALSRNNDLYIFDTPIALKIANKAQQP